MERSAREHLVIMSSILVLIGAAGCFLCSPVTPLCVPPPDQARMIVKFEDDPLLEIAAAHGRLTEATTASYQCDNGKGGSPTWPEFAMVSRTYTTAGLYSSQQLVQWFTQAAVASGWAFTSRPGVTHEGRLTFTRRYDQGIAYASVVSEYKPAREFTPKVAQLVVSMSAHPDKPLY